MATKTRLTGGPPCVLTAERLKQAVSEVFEQAPPGSSTTLGADQVGSDFPTPRELGLLPAEVEVLFPEVPELTGFDGPTYDIRDFDPLADIGGE